MDLDEAFGKLSEFNIKDHCHVNTNEDGDRFVGIKADTDDAMVYFPIGYQLIIRLIQAIMLRCAHNHPYKTDLFNVFQLLVCFTPVNHFLCRSATAYTYIGKVFLFKWHTS